METYFWKLKYYNDFSEDDRIAFAYGAVGAESYADAVSKLEYRFPKTAIDEIEIYDAFCCNGFVFFNSEEEWKRQLQEHRDD